MVAVLQSLSIGFWISQFEACNLGILRNYLDRPILIVQFCFYLKQHLHLVSAATATVTTWAFKSQ